MQLYPPYKLILFNGGKGEGLRAKMIKYHFGMEESNPRGFESLPAITKKENKINSFSLMAEKVGFEPTVQITPHNTLAGCRLKPTRPLFPFRYILS